MAEERLRRNLDVALDPGPDFPSRAWLSQTMAAIENDVPRATRIRGIAAARDPLDLLWRGRRVAAIVAVIALAVAATAGFLAIHSKVGPAPVHPPLGIAPHDVGLCSPTGSTTCGFAGQPVFVSANVGWLTEDFIDQGSVACNPACPKAVLFRTDDGGSHWSVQVGLPGYSQKILASPDGREVLVVPQGDLGAALFHSTDGGAHWTAFPVPAGLGESAVTQCNFSNPPCTITGPTELIDFINPREGWVLSQEASFTMADLFHTTDSGASWSSTRVDLRSAFKVDPAKGWTDSAGHVDHTLYGKLFFRDSSTGWFAPVTACVDSGAGCGQQFGWDLYMTHDGGRTWLAQSLQPPAGTPPGATVTIDTVRLAANDPNGTLALRVTAPNATQPDPRPYVYTTSDGGDHWLNPTQVPGSSSLSYVQLDLIDATHWVAWSSSGVIHTSDGGQRWDSLPSASFLLNVLWLMFADPSHGWAYGEVAGGFVLDRTTDGGVHWTRAGIPEMGCSSCLTTPAPSPPPGGPVPSQLLGYWDLSPAAVSSILQASGKGTCPTPLTAATCKISLQLTDTEYFWPNNVGLSLAKGGVVVKGNEIDFWWAADCGPDAANSTGRYKWTLAGGVLHLTSLNKDPCPRSVLLANQSFMRGS